MSSPRVVAVVVAYNRRDLLREALDALMLQSRPLDAVVVVDNASTDGSADLARGTDGVEVLALTANTGGAGGFAVGIAHAVAELGADLVWAMDDDTIPEIDALAALLAARDAHPGTSVWGSRVVWTDGSDHPMNTPRPRPLRSSRAADGSFEVRSTSFVSMLVEASSVRRVGLPIADYFIWNDDFEYSTRLLRGQRGRFVPGSRVLHKTKALASTDVDPGERFYFEVRNKLWMLRRSRSLAAWEKALYGASSLLRWARTFRGSTDRALLADAGRRGWSDGWRTAPRPNAAVLAPAGPAAETVRALEESRG